MPDRARASSACAVDTVHCDIARFDAEGRLFIVDRLKELIKVKAFIVRRDPTASALALIEHVARQVAPYERLHGMEFFEAIPKSPSRQIMRRLLRDALRDGPRDKRREAMGNAARAAPSS